MISNTQIKIKQFGQLCGWRRISVTSVWICTLPFALVLQTWWCVVRWLYAEGFFGKILKSIPHLLIGAQIQHGYCLNIFLLKGHLSPEIRSLTVLSSL